MVVRIYGTRYHRTQKDSEKVIPDFDSSGSEINFKKLLWKTDKIWHFLNNNAPFKKYKFLFIKKNSLNA